MGVRAGLAVFRIRPSDILRLAYSGQAPSDIEPLVRWADAEGVTCEEVDDRELDRRAESSHHEGLCLLTRPRTWVAPARLTTAMAESGGITLALDGVRNPYNVGAILRSAAFLGIDAVLFGAQALSASLSPLAGRVAEGGAESVLLSRTTDLAATLARLRAAGAVILGTDGTATDSAFGYSYPKATVLVVGNERGGMSERVRAECSAVLSIPGSGAVESLNVSVAAGILMAEARRSVKGRLPTAFGAPSRSTAGAPAAPGTDRGRRGHVPPRSAR